MATFKSVVTKLGQARIAAAMQSGKDINIIEMAVGDGGGKPTQPSAAQTKLVKEVYRTKLNSLKLDAKNANWIIAEAIISASVGGFWMREMGLYADNGTLIAVCNMADTYKPTLAEGSGRTQTLRMVITVTDTSAVSLTMDDTLIIATEEYVNDLLAAHEKSRNHPDGTLTEKGFVQLSSATSSVSEALAATPKAVKAANDNANGRVPITRKVNGKALNADITLAASDVGAMSNLVAPLNNAIKRLDDPAVINVTNPVSISGAFEDFPLGPTVVAAAQLLTLRRAWDAGAGAYQQLINGDGQMFWRIGSYSAAKGWAWQLNSAAYPFGWRRAFDTGNAPTPAEVGAWSAKESADNAKVLSDQIVSTAKELSDEIATAFKTRPNLTATDSPNSLRGPDKFGHYGVPGAAAASTEKGYPINNFVGCIFVMWGPNNTQQVAFNNTGRQWTRGMAGAWNGVDGPWSVWAETYSVNNKPTATDVGALPVLKTSLGNTNINTLGLSLLGVYPQVTSASASVANGYPSGAASGTLEVLPSAWANGALQRYTNYINGLTWTRGLTAAWNGTDGPWRDWVQSSSAGSIFMDTLPLSATSDLNAIGLGIYFQSRDANATAALNYPVALSGTLVVTPSAYGVQQEYTTYRGAKYLRGATNAAGAWGAWAPVYTGNNPPPYPVKKVNGKTGDVTLSASDVAAVPTAGGNVGYLDNANHYSIKPGQWEGYGSFSSQFSSPSAPFVVPRGHSASKGVSQYAPLIKGLLDTTGYGYAAAVSFGIYTTGDGKFPSACINVTGDSGASQAWMFNPEDGAFHSPGYLVSAAGLSVTGNANITGSITAGGAVYESNGAVRVYSPNYRPAAADVGAVGKDSCNYAGFAGADVNLPYMRHESSGTVVQLMPRIPDYQQVGTYVIAWCNAGDIDPNQNVSGSNLFPSTADGLHVGWSLGGTWRCMGASRTVNDAHRTTLWMRVY